MAGDLVGVEGLRVASHRCDQCIFGAHAIVDRIRKDEILLDCEKSGRCFECHKGTIRGESIVCAGFSQAEARGDLGNATLKVARRLRFVQYVDPETGKPEGDR